MKQAKFDNEINAISKSIIEMIDMASKKIAETVNSKTLTENEKRIIVITIKDNIDDLIKLLK